MEAPVFGRSCLRQRNAGSGSSHDGSRSRPGLPAITGVLRVVLIFDPDGFDDLLADADERFERGLEDAPQLFGFDIDSQAVGIARGNARRLGLSKLVTFGCADCADLPVSLHQNGIEFDQRGFIAINPPYGMRLLAHGLDGFYEHLSRGLRELSDSWSMTVIAAR